MGFHPWQGDQYEGGAFFGQKVLLVGESHYGPNMGDRPEFTRDTVLEVCKGNRIDFFIALGHACAGRTAYDANPARFWHSVSFMNFVDRLVGPTAKDKPSPAMWAEAKKSFLSRVGNLRPDRIILFSAEAWKNLPDFPHGEDGVTFYADEPEKAWMGYYTLPNGPVPVMYAQHPNTRGWVASMWRALIMRFLMEPLPPAQSPKAATGIGQL